MAFQIQELFMFKADWSRTFIGNIRRDHDIDGKNILFGQVNVDGVIYSSASCENELGNKMDELIRLKLDHHIHSPKMMVAFLGDYIVNLN